MVKSKILNLFLFFFLVFSFYIISPYKSHAADCGGDIVCSCGDTIIENYTLQNDLSCSGAGDGLIVGADNLIIDGNSHDLVGPIGDYEVSIATFSGIFVSDFNNIVIKNFNLIKGFDKGINLINSTNDTIENNIIKFMKHGIHISSASSNNINNNVLESNDSGIHILSSSSSNLIEENKISLSNSTGLYLDDGPTNNTLTGNILKFNNNGIYFYRTNNNIIDNNIIISNTTDILNTTSTNSILNNKISGNLKNRMFNFVEIPRVVNVGDTINFSISLYNASKVACNNCVTNILVSPEQDLNLIRVNNIVNGNFIPTHEGLYSLILNITDENDNITKRKYMFIVGDNEQVSKRFYYRKLPATHDQPVGNDAWVLLSTPPNDNEQWSCSAWIQNSLDQIPDYPLASLSSINVHSFYSSEFDGSIGIQRFHTYSEFADITNFIPQTTFDFDAVFDLASHNFNNLDWSMDYLNSWYNLTSKTNGGNIYLNTDPSEFSYVDLTYLYPTSPIIKSISNDDTIILSATTPNSSSISSIVLENPLDEKLDTTLTFENFNKPFLSDSTTIYSDKSNVLDLSIDANTLYTLENIPMEISLITGNVEVIINEWSDGGDYHRNWSEDYSTTTNSTHIIKNLEANKNYSIKIDDVLSNDIISENCSEGLCESNSQGEISFEYQNINSQHTFDLSIAIEPKESKGGSRVMLSPIVVDPVVKIDTILCPLGFTYDTVSGKKCTDFITLNHCDEGDLYNKETGAKCTTSVSTVVQPLLFTRTLKRGISGEDVKILQIYLNAHNFASPLLVTDGVFGLKTKASVILFQKANNLTTDGAVGPKTRMEMK